MPGQTSARWMADAARRTLKKLHIPFQGPFVTSEQNCIYVVHGSILTDREIIALHKDGRLSQ
jgi:hypothetical protein